VRERLGGCLAAGQSTTHRKEESQAICRYSSYLYVMRVHADLMGVHRQNQSQHSSSHSVLVGTHDFCTLSLLHR